MTLVRDVIDEARSKHWAFADVQLGDGAALLFINRRQRSLLLKFRDAVRAIVNQTMQQAGVVAGVLVGLDSGGVPYYLTTYEDGYPIQFDGGGVPYIDTSAAPISYDPFGVNGGTPGWPLPTDAIALLSLTAVYQDTTTGPIEVVDEAVRYQGPPTRYPTVYITGNRLVPLRKPSNTSGQPDIWTSVTAVQLSYIPFSSVALLTDALTLPGPLIEAIVSGLVEMLAMQSPKCTATERAGFTAARKEKEAEISVNAFDLLGDFQSSNVIYEGEQGG